MEYEKEYIYIYTYMWNHFTVYQKLTQHCKSIILQFFLILRDLLKKNKVLLKLRTKGGIGSIRNRGKRRVG